MAQGSTRLVMGRRQWGMLFLLSFIWGGSFLLYKLLVADLPVFTVVFGRVALAAVALHLLLAARGDPVPLEARLWGRFLLLGLVNNAVPFALIAFGETRIASGLASILNATTPLFTVLAVHLVTDNEKLSPGKLCGVALGLGGVVVLIGPGIGGLSGTDLEGQAACLGAALAYAVGTLYGRSFRGLPPIHVATGQVTGAAILMLPVTLAVDRPWTLPAPGAATWAALALLAWVCTAFAYLIYFRILAAAGATNLVLVTFLVPVSAILLGAVVLGEALTGGAVAGMVLIALGLGAIDGRPWRLLRARVLAARV